VGQKRCRRSGQPFPRSPAFSWRQKVEPMTCSRSFRRCRRRAVIGPGDRVIGSWCPVWAMSRELKDSNRRVRQGLAENAELTFLRELGEFLRELCGLGF